MGRNLLPVGGIGGHGAGDAAIDDAFFKRWDHFGESHCHGCAADTFDEITQGGGVDADFLAIEVFDPVDFRVAPERLAWERVQHQELGVVDFGECFFERREIRLGHFALSVDVLCQRRQVRAFEDRVFGGDVARQTEGKVKHAVFHEAHDFKAFEAKTGLRLDIANDFATRGFGEAFVEERRFVFLEIGQAGPCANSLENDRVLGKGRTGGQGQGGGQGCEFLHGYLR